MCQLKICMRNCYLPSKFLFFLQKCAQKQINIYSFKTVFILFSGLLPCGNIINYAYNAAEGCCQSRWIWRFGIFCHDSTSIIQITRLNYIFQESLWLCRSFLFFDIINTKAWYKRKRDCTSFLNVWTVLLTNSGRARQSNVVLEIGIILIFGSFFILQ